MEESLVIALDQGTTSARAVVFSERTLPVAAYQVELTQIYPNPGWVEHDPLQLVEACRTCLLQVASQLTAKGIHLSQVKALGIANQRETSVLWDRRTGLPVANAIVWSDTRTEQLVQEMKLRPDAARVPELCGLHLSAYFAATKVRWLLDNNESVKRVYNEGELCFGTVDSWLIYALSGGAAHVTDASNASRSMLMNLETLEYDEFLINFFGFERLILPQVLPSSHIYGLLSMPGQPLDGLPIAGCVGDQSAALAGHLAFEEGTAKCTYGTGGFLLYNTGHKPVLRDDGLLTTVAFQLPGAKATYALEGSIAVCGSAIKWLRNNLQLIETSEQVGDLIESVPDTAGVYFVTAFNGLYSPHWNADARGTIVGLTFFATKAHIVRAAVEAVCYQVRTIFEIMQHGLAETAAANGQRPSTERVLRVDGGLSSSDVAMQLQADLFGGSVVRPAMREVTALGAAFMAGFATGVWKDIEHARQQHALASGDNTTYYSTTNQDFRDKLYNQWQRAVRRATDWFQREPELEPVDHFK